MLEITGLDYHQSLSSYPEAGRKNWENKDSSIGSVGLEAKMEAGELLIKLR